jgi:hypothetical protein
VISSCAANSPAIRRLGTLNSLVFCCMFLPIGCGEPSSQKSTLPPAEFADKLEKEQPGIFVEKIGKSKTAVLGGRDKRAVIRREQEKSREGSQ